jgi:hypothetical protein
MVVSYEGCDDEECEEEEPKERDDALSELMELEKYLSPEIDKMKADSDCCLSEDGVENSISIEALCIALDAPVAPRFDVYSDEEQQNPTSQFSYQKSIQLVYDSYESESELDMQDFPEKNVAYPLFAKEYYPEEISHLRSTGDSE